ncbi:hypothetical protein DRP04_09820 [Archaeoglobales archaeon]|nr:MAG: hypothetical protein DRP04_09820 [Archaeoglobales archaeon]
MEKLELRLRLFFIAEIVVLIGVIGFFNNLLCFGEGSCYELHPHYSPLNAFTFWTVMNIALVLLEPTKKW